MHYFRKVVKYCWIRWPITCLSVLIRNTRWVLFQESYVMNKIQEQVLAEWLQLHGYSGQLWWDILCKKLWKCIIISNANHGSMVLECENGSAKLFMLLKLVTWLSNKVRQQINACNINDTFCWKTMCDYILILSLSKFSRSRKTFSKDVALFDEFVWLKHAWNVRFDIFTMIKQIQQAC